MLIFPNYDLADATLRTVWRSIECLHYEIRDRWVSFEKSPVESIAPILDQMNGRLKRIHFETGIFFDSRLGLVETTTGDAFLNPILIWKILSAMHERNADNFQNRWLDLTDTLLHELIHQKQRDENPEAFASWHRDSRERNRGKDFLYCQAVNPYEIPAHAFTDATRIRRCLKLKNGTVNLAAAKAMVSTANPHCPPVLFYHELLEGESVPPELGIFEKYKSTACAYLDALDAAPEPPLFVPAITWVAENRGGYLSA